MYSDKQKNEFALLRAEGASFNSIGYKLIDECKLVKRIPVNLIECHSFVIFLSVFFYYVIVFSTPKMSYMKFL